MIVSLSSQKNNILCLKPEIWQKVWEVQGSQILLQGTILQLSGNYYPIIILLII